ncbi:MAG: hypothetical protein HKN26_04780 [Acidimicrobiales bacterium]|nr:hypothetical protein [Acidimicrobiales bacterium]
MATGLAMGALVLATRHEPIFGADEGYLWYGVLEVLRGAMPVRDFRSYEPGRYWVLAPFLWVGRRGLLAVRIGSTAVLAVGLFGLTLVGRSAGLGWGSIGAVVVVGTVWAIRPHKRIDQGVLLGLTAATVHFLDAPGPTSATILGLSIGVAAVFGLNHGLYGAVIFVLVVVLGALKTDLSIGSVAGYGAAGVAVGAAPLWLTALARPGLLRALVHRRLVAPTQRRSTNLPLPYPVPGRPSPQLTSALPVGLVPLVRAVFCVVPLLALVATVVAFLAGGDGQIEQPVLTGAAVVALVAWHHVTSRADLGHLQTVAPVAMVGLVAAGVVGLVIAAVVSVLVGPVQFETFKRWRHPERYFRPDSPVPGLWFRRTDGALLAAVAELGAGSSPGSCWIAVPLGGWILPLFDRRSAVYDTFCVYPASPDEQRAMITQLRAAQPEVAIIRLEALDGRDDLRFDRTHPAVWEYLNTAFVSAEVATPLPESIRVFRSAG